jgi:hypothetical protein
MSSTLNTLKCNNNYITHLLKLNHTSLENLEYYFEAEIPKIQEAYNFMHNEREQNDNIAINNLKDESKSNLIK